MPVKLGSLKEALSFFRALWRLRPDAILELHKSGRSSKILRVFAGLTGARYIAHDHNKNTGEIFEQGVRKPIIQRDLDGAYTLACTYDEKAKYPSYLEYAPRFKKRRGDELGVVLGVVATREEKKWPLSHYAELVRFIKLAHPELPIYIPLSKSAEDEEIKGALQSLMSAESEALFIQAPLANLGEVLSKGHLYIGNDTGLKHICVALGYKTWTLFGPEEPIEWHPYDYQKHPFFWIYGGDVRTRMVEQCKLVQFDRSRDLSEITPEEVYEQLYFDLIK